MLLNLKSLMNHFSKKKVHEIEESAVSSTERTSILYETFGRQGGTRHSTEKFKLSYICSGLNVEMEKDIDIEFTKEVIITLNHLKTLKVGMHC